MESREKNFKADSSWCLRNKFAGIGFNGTDALGFSAMPGGSRSTEKIAGDNWGRMTYLTDGPFELAATKYGATSSWWLDSDKGEAVQMWIYAIGDQVNTGKQSKDGEYIYINIRGT